MEVKILLFATLRQLAGWKERVIELPGGANLGDLLKLLTEAQPQLNLSQRTIYAAVNEEYAQRDTLLKEKDVVAIFPPVSGGSDGRRDLHHEQRLPRAHSRMRSMP